MKIITILILSIYSTFSYAISDYDIYTLYRNSVFDENMRVHVATFDAADGKSYNLDNCQQTRDLIMKQENEPKLFWCEQGRFRE